jgi:hypothetical protein
MSIAELPDQPVLPREMAYLVARFGCQGWPDQPIIIPEQE